MLLGPVGAQIITVIVPLAQKTPEKDEPAQGRDDQDVGEAFRAKHKIMQGVDGIPHGFFSPMDSAPFPFTAQGAWRKAQGKESNPFLREPRAIFVF
jgi:hypothetical protein